MDTLEQIAARTHTGGAEHDATRAEVANAADSASISSLDALLDGSFDPSTSARTWAATLSGSAFRSYPAHAHRNFG